MKEKGNKKMPIPTQEIIDNPNPTSLVTYAAVLLFEFLGLIEKQRCRDGVINNFLSRYRHLLVPLLFHDLTSLHPLHFREMIFPLVYILF